MRQVSSKSGMEPENLRAALKDADIVIIPAGVPRKPGMTRDDLFNINAGIVRGIAEGVAEYVFSEKTFFSLRKRPLRRFLTDCDVSFLSSPSVCVHGHCAWEEVRTPPSLEPILSCSFSVQCLRS